MKRTLEKQKFLSSIYILLYSIINRLFTSLYSVRFSKEVMEVDGACFYDVGRAILSGKVLYKDVFDHKTPYIYFINALGSLIEFNHIGLFIIEVLVLFFTLFYTYKFLMLVIDRNDYSKKYNLSDEQSINVFSLISVFLMGIVYSIRNVCFGYSRTEAFAVVFMMPALYLFTKNYILIKNEQDGVILNKRLPMFIIGILAGLTFMTNIKAAILFIPFAFVTAFLCIKQKRIRFIFELLLFGMLGVIVSILPYVVYMLVTNSFNDMVYALIDTNIAYSKSNISMQVIGTEGSNRMEYNTNSGLIATVVAFTIMEPIVMILIYASIVFTFALKYNKYVKIAICLSAITAFLYTMLSGRLHTYYLYIFLPYFLSICILIIKISLIIKNTFKLIIKSKYVVLTVFILSLAISYLLNAKNVFVMNYNHMNRATKMKNIVAEYNSDIKKLRVFAFGFTPEIYNYLGANIDYKYFILPSVSYKVSKKAFLEQYRYVNEVDPDIVVLNPSFSLSTFPSDLKNMIAAKLNMSYDFIGEVEMNKYAGSYYVFGKKR